MGEPNAGNPYYPNKEGHMVNWNI